MITNVMTKYINALCAQHFRGKEIQDKDILIDKAGWYWADSEDNIRYTDFTGPFNSKEEAQQYVDSHSKSRGVDKAYFNIKENEDIEGLDKLAVDSYGVPFNSLNREQRSIIKQQLSQNSSVNETDLPLDQSGEFEGWIAMYNGKKLEIKKGEADGIYGAKMIAAKQLNVPRSKMGLLSIHPAHK